MNKAAAEIIAGLIPVKMERNRWRGILRYGLWKSFRLRREIRKHKEKPAFRLAVCAIAKDEGPYLREWIEWHRDNGVEKFYFYDNGSKDNTREILEPYIRSGLVDYKYYPGYRRQIAAYDDCIRRHRYECRWLAFIDIDEFIVPLADGSITEFLSRFEDFSAVEINWLVYGSGGHTEKNGLPVMKRFTSHAEANHKLNRHVKSIVDPRKVVCMTGCHEAARLMGSTADSRGEVVSRNFRQREPLLDVIRINHYAVKSKEEFLEKQSRGRASGKKRNVPDEYFAEYDRNEIKEEP